MGLFNKFFGGKDGEEDPSESQDAKPASPSKATDKADAAADKKTAQSTAQKPPRPVGSEDAGRLNTAPANDRKPGTAAAAAKPAQTTQASSATTPAASGAKPPPLKKSREDTSRTSTTAAGTAAGLPRTSPSTTTDTTRGKKPSPAEAASPAVSPVAKSAASTGATTAAATGSTAARTQRTSPKPEAAEAPARPSPAPIGRVATGASPTPTRASTVAQAKPPEQATAADPKAQLRDLLERTRPHFSHLEQFAWDLELDCAPPRWATACRPAIDALCRSAHELELGDVEKGLTALRDSVRQLSDTANGKLDPEARRQVLESYAALAGSLEEGLRVPPPASEREPLIVESLLHQMPGMHSVALDKLRSGGWLSLQKLARADCTKLASEAALDVDAARAISARAREVCEGYGKPAATEARRHLVEVARSAVDSLTRAQERFTRAEDDEDREAKRLARRDREQHLRALAAVFAQLGEIEPAKEMERGSVPQRIERARALIADWG